MIGYILLVVIAISLSIAVFAYLKLYLPKDEPKCHDDVSLTIEEAKCENGLVSLTLGNRGLFTVEGVFIRMGDEDRIFRVVLNKDDVVFDPLEPGNSWNAFYNYTPSDITKPQILEIEPVQYIENQAVLCENSVISRRILCS